MLVLLVSERDVVVDDAPPLENGEPPPSLTFRGPDVIGAGATMHRGPDLVYRLAGRANLDPYGKGDDAPQAAAAALGAAHAMRLGELRALPVYLELAPSTAEAFLAAQDIRHPVVAGGAVRPRLRVIDGDAPVDPPHFDLGGFAAALKVGGIVEGMRIRLSGFAEPDHNGLYEVGPVADGDDGVRTAGVRKVGEDAFVELAAVSDQERLLEGAQAIADAIVDPGLRAKAQAHIDGARDELGT